MKTVVALYANSTKAADVVTELRDIGVSSEAISVMASERAGAFGDKVEDPSLTGLDVIEVSDEDGSGAATGAGVGALAGGLTGLLVGLGALAIPGIGPVLAAGPLAAALVGAGVGAVAGGVIGAFTDMGVPEEDAEYFAEAVRRGNTIVVVRAENEVADRAAEIMYQHAPLDMDEEVGRWREEGWTGFKHGAATPDITDKLVADKLSSEEGIGGLDEPAMDRENAPDLGPNSGAFVTRANADTQGTWEPQAGQGAAAIPDEERHPRRQGTHTTRMPMGSGSSVRVYSEEDYGDRGA